MVVGQGLCKLLIEIGALTGDISISIGSSSSTSEWYNDIIFYLKSGPFPYLMSPKERRALKLKEIQYVLVDEILFRINFDGILLRCIDSTKHQKVIQKFHEGVFHGHFSPMTTTHKIMRVGYYWPIIFNDSYAMIHKCISC
jgi:hypothetical protein